MADKKKTTAKKSTKKAATKKVAPAKAKKPSPKTAAKKSTTAKAKPAVKKTAPKAKAAPSKADTPKRVAAAPKMAAQSKPQAMSCDTKRCCNENIIWIIVLIVIVVAVIVISKYVNTASLEEPDNSRVVANYSGGSITVNEINNLLKANTGNDLFTFDTINPKLRETVVKKAVLREIILQKAIDDNLDQQKSIREEMARYEKQLMVDKWPVQNVESQISEEEIKEKYSELVSDLSKKEEVKTRHILVKTKQEARKAKRQIAASGNFEAVAAKLSLDKANSNNGGDLGWVMKGRLVPAVEQVVFSLKKGQVSEPVKSKFGWHIVKVEDKRQARAADYEEVREKVKQQLAKQKVKELLDQLVDEAKIENLESGADEAEQKPNNS